MTFALATIGYGALVGFSLGLTGSGGSILAIPLLVYGLGMPFSQAIVVSLLMVATIALFGAVRQSFQKNVDWRAAIFFSLAGMVVSPLVIHLAHGVDDTLRLVLFAGFMLFVAFRMGIKRKKEGLKEASQSETRDSPLLGGIKTVSGGGLAGALSGFFGVGGGFVIVPLLTIIFHLPYRVAVGTSLASIFMISIAAVGGAFTKGASIDWTLFFEFVGGGAVGMLLGIALVNAIPDRPAKIVFALVMTALAVFMLIDNLYLHQGGL